MIMLTMIDLKAKFGVKREPIARDVRDMGVTIRTTDPRRQSA
jgi:hypothetical protein